MGDCGYREGTMDEGKDKRKNREEIYGRALVSDLSRVSLTERLKGAWLK